MRASVIVLFALAMGACDRTSHETSHSRGNKGANSAAEVPTLDPRQRDVVLFRAIRDAGLACQDIIRAEQIEDMTRKPTWRARCEDGASHLIIINADRTATVVGRMSR